MPDFLNSIWSFMQKIGRFLKDTWASVYAYGLYVRAWFAPRPYGFDEILNRIRANDPELTHLNLSERGLSYWNIIELCYVLTSNTALKSLNVAYNYIGDAGVQALAANTSLRSLDVSTNRIGVSGAEALAANTTLTSLDIGVNHLGVAGALALAANRTLTSLNIRENGIGISGARVLAANTTLISLNVHNNELGNAGAIALAANRTLTSLNIRGNGVRNAGAQALAANASLTSLDVSDNEISYAGAQALAANASLTSLDISFNQIGDAGGRFLAANTTLTSLNVVYNYIDYAMRLLLSNAITRNKQLMIDTKKTILGLHAFASIVNSTHRGRYLPTMIAHHIGSFLTGDSEDNARRLNEIDRRATVRSSRDAFFQPAVLVASNEPSRLVI